MFSTIKLLSIKYFKMLKYLKIKIFFIKTIILTYNQVQGNEDFFVCPVHDNPVWAIKTNIFMATGPVQKVPFLLASLIYSCLFSCLNYLIILLLFLLFWFLQETDLIIELMKSATYFGLSESAYFQYYF